jgi:hypothetical protein
MEIAASIVNGSNFQHAAPSVSGMRMKTGKQAHSTVFAPVSGVMTNANGAFCAEGAKHSHNLP